MDFDEEADKLWASMGLERGVGDGHNPMDPLWRSADTGATLFVGGVSAARDIDLLRGAGVCRVVNCTVHAGGPTTSGAASPSACYLATLDTVLIAVSLRSYCPLSLRGGLKNFHEKQDDFKYIRFDASRFSRPMNHVTEKSCSETLGPLVTFVTEALNNGQSVLVHCKAGAHRAGTTGVLLLMHFAGLDNHEALGLAKTCRPVINPIGSFPELLQRANRLPRTDEGQFQLDVRTQALDHDSEKFPFEVGQQILTSKEEEGTIRFVGPVVGKDAVWVGVELCAAEGRNSGDLDGVTYFVCAPGHGVFVRAGSLRLLSNTCTTTSASVE